MCDHPNCNVLWQRNVTLQRKHILELMKHSGRGTVLACHHNKVLASLIAQWIRNPPAMQETLV